MSTERCSSQISGTTSPKGFTVKKALVSLYFKPLEWLEKFLNKFTLTHYEKWDIEKGKWVLDPTQPVSEADAALYRGVTVAIFGALALGILVVALAVIL